LLDPPLPALPEEPTIPVVEVVARDDVALATLDAIAPPAPVAIVLEAPDADDDPDEPAPPSGWAVSSGEQAASSVVTSAHAAKRRSWPGMSMAPCARCVAGFRAFSSTTFVATILSRLGPSRLLSRVRV
jgi:hypothetical protein